MQTWKIFDLKVHCSNLIFLQSPYSNDFFHTRISFTAYLITYLNSSLFKWIILKISCFYDGKQKKLDLIKKKCSNWSQIWVMSGSEIWQISNCSKSIMVWDNDLKFWICSFHMDTSNILWNQPILRWWVSKLDEL